jgi:two-component system, cell cycle response regulator DivK
MVKVLIIEDNEENMYLFGFILRKHGYEVIEAKDGIQGLDTAVRENPDLILLDIQLPQLDGYEVVRRLRKSNTHQNVPIIAITSFALTGDKDKCLNVGCDDYMEKPIDPEKFISMVNRYKEEIKR